MDKKLYKFGMDWLNGVLPETDVYSVFKFLGMISSKLRFERWELVSSGLYNYSRRYCLDGKGFIQLMYNPVSEEEYLTACKPLELVAGEKVFGTNNNSGIFFSISGDGIRYLHSLGGEVSALNKLLFYFYKHSFKASRFDVYCDILDKNNKVVPLLQTAISYVGKEQIGQPIFTTRFNRTPSTINNNFKKIPMLDENYNEFFNVQIGHHGSNIGMFRCYNKRVEVLSGRLARLDSDKPKKNGLKTDEIELSFAQQLFKEYGVTDYWYRLEYEMHKDNANACFNALMSNAVNCNSPLCFEDIFICVSSRVFNIVDLPSIGYKLSDAPTHAIWFSFLESVKANSIHLVQLDSFKSFVPYIDVSLSQLDSNMERTKGYFYLQLQRFLSLPPDVQLSYLVRGSDRFTNNKKYNSIRDELDLVPLKNIQALLQNAGLIA